MGRLILQTGLLALSFWGALVACGFAADAPNAKQADPKLNRGNQAAALEELLQFRKQALEFQNAGKIAEAITAGEKVAQLAGKLHGKDSEEVAAWEEWLGRRHDGREEWPAARKAHERTLAIRAKLYGEKDWRVTDARWEVRTIDLRSRLTAEQRAELAQAADAMRQLRKLNSAGEDLKAIPIGKRALEIRRRILGGEHPLTTESCAWLAYVYDSAKKYGEAKPLYQQALDVRKKIFGTEHPDTADTLNDLGLYYRVTGDATKAESFARQAVTIRKKLLGDNHLDTAISLNNLGLIHVDLKQYAQAEPLFLQALKIHKTALGEKHAQTALSLSNLGWLYKSMESYPKAEPFYRQALDIRRQVFGEDHPKTIAAMGDLAGLYELMEQYAKAEPLRKNMVEIRRKVLGPEAPLTATSLNNLGMVYVNLEQYAKAELPLQQALKIRRTVLGEKHPHTALSLDNLGWLYKSMESYPKAEPFYRQALDIRRQVLGADHPRTIASMQHLANLYELMEQYAKAEPLRKNLVEIRRKVLGPAAPLTATSLNDLGVLYWNMRDYAPAERAYLESLEIRKKGQGEQRSETALTLTNLGTLYQSEKDYAKALPLYRQALEIHRKHLGEVHPKTIRTAHNLANALQQTGDDSAAESLCQQVLEACTKRLGPVDPLTTECKTALAALYLSGKEYAKAESLYRQAIEDRKRTLGERHRLTASSLVDLARVFLAMGDYAKAESHLRHALDIRRAIFGEQHLDTAATLDELSTLYKSVGDYAKAEPLARRTLEIQRKLFGEDNAATASSLGGLARLYIEMEDYAKAEPLQLEALAIQKRILGEEHAATALSMINLAAMYHRQKLYDKAEPLYRRALEIRTKLFGDAHEVTAICLNNLAELYRSTGQYAKAEPLYLRSLAMCERSFGRESVVTAASFDNLSLFYRSMGDDAKAVRFATQSLEIIQTLLDRNLRGLAERQQLTFERTLNARFHSYLSTCLAAKVDATEVYRSVLKSKGSVTARQSLIRLQRRRPELKALFDDLEKVSTRLGNLALAPADPKQAQARVHEIEQLTEQKERLEGRLAAQSDDFAQIREATALGPKQLLDKLQQALPPKTALVDVLEYWNIDPSKQQKGAVFRNLELVAFVVRNDAPVKRVELGLARDLGKAVDNWRKVAVLPDRPKSNGAEFLKQLKALVWDRLEPHLAGAETILFSPDGPLCRFPLGALPGSKPDSYLIEDRTIVVLPIPRLLPEMLAAPQDDRGKPESQSLLLVGDVEYGGSPGQADQVASRSAPRSQSLHSFGRLDHSAAEVAAIQLSFSRHFKKAPVELLLGEDATESSFRREAATHRWLHLATHGFYDPPELSALAAATDPKGRTSLVNAPSEQSDFEHAGMRGYHPGLLSGLALAGANCQTVKAGDDDGILTALEVSSLDLGGVELAVLSACETGLGATAGETAGGEGLLGLQRAFQIAGARSVMAGLWRVPDRETMLLMQRFYQNLWTKKLPKAQALREAQIWMLKETKPRGLDVDGEAPNTSKRLLPKYWAGFVLSGDWR
jgi:CHAT domain-containing protein/tetratricopeptide (TPR) repeat protein